jgi:hypothetical protein
MPHDPRELRSAISIRGVSIRAVKVGNAEVGQFLLTVRVGSDGAWGELALIESVLLLNVD